MSMIIPGAQWLDSAGRPIQAHGGCILHFRNRYYWYGENKDGPNVGNLSFERVDFIGISCYSSPDLLHWTYEGLVLTPEAHTPDHDLHPHRVVERPKVVYHDDLHQFVMWMHVDTADYTYARAGVAVSTSPTGPFQYVGSLRPCDTDCRDLTLFQDVDGTAYVIFASEWNRNITIAQLTPDYLNVQDAFTKWFSTPYRSHGREAPALCRSHNTYYMVTSGCTGWEANSAEFASAHHPFGPWEVRGNPCSGPEADKTFYAQSTFIFPIDQNAGHFLFMADRWNAHHLTDSRYVWLPLTVTDQGMDIHWQDQWDISTYWETDGHRYK